MKIRNEIKIACEGLHCLILLVMISPVRRALVGVAQLVERMFYMRSAVRIRFPAQL